MLWLICVVFGQQNWTEQGGMLYMHTIGLGQFSMFRWDCYLNFSYSYNCVVLYVVSTYHGLRGKCFFTSNNLQLKDNDINVNTNVLIVTTANHIGTCSSSLYCLWVFLEQITCLHWTNEWLYCCNRKDKHTNPRYFPTCGGAYLASRSVTANGNLIWISRMLKLLISHLFWLLDGYHGFGSILIFFHLK